MFCKFILMLSVASSCISFDARPHCPDYKKNLAHDFDTKQFSGYWYYYARYALPAPMGITCISVNYIYINDTTLDITFMGVKKQVFDFIRTVINSDGLVKVGESGYIDRQLRIFYTGPNPIEVGGTSFYTFLLEVDYKKYAILWDCSDIISGYIEDFWILTRKRVFQKISEDMDTIAEIWEQIEKYDHKKDEFVFADQTDCTKYD